MHYLDFAEINMQLDHQNCWWGGLTISQVKDEKKKIPKYDMNNKVSCLKLSVTPKSFLPGTLFLFHNQ